MKEERCIRAFEKFRIGALGSCWEFHGWERSQTKRSNKLMLIAKTSLHVASELCIWYTKHRSEQKAMDGINPCITNTAPHIDDGIWHDRPWQVTWHFMPVTLSRPANNNPSDLCVCAGLNIRLATSSEADRCLATGDLDKVSLLTIRMQSSFLSGTHLKILLTNSCGICLIFCCVCCGSGPTNQTTLNTWPTPRPYIAEFSDPSWVTRMAALEGRQNLTNPKCLNPVH